MSDVVIKVVDESCAWGGGSECCDDLEGALAGYADGATWELPLQMRLQVLEAKTSELTGRKVTVQEADLLRLEGADREAAIFAFTSGAEYPLVIVDGVLACTGSLDIDSIAAAVSQAEEDPSEEQ